jgi:formate hydrogenlyase subunit 6/NADH:ubiquinone oxidoreductase subunit I
VEPRISRSRCSRCGDCVEKCAAGAIAISRGGYPSVDLSSCIRCYCCAEYCAAGAVTMSGGIINHLIRAVRHVKRI